MAPDFRGIADAEPRGRAVGLNRFGSLAEILFFPA
jgi:hypothetical protein